MTSFFPPIASSGSRSPEKRPRPLPKHVKLMLALMVRGREDDPDQRPLDFIEAGRVAGIAPDRARRWLDRPEVRSFLRAERRAYRLALLASNEAYLARVRAGGNPMASVRACVALEQLDQVETSNLARGPVQSPGITIIIENSPAPRPVGPVVDVTPQRELEPGDDRGDSG